MRRIHLIEELCMHKVCFCYHPLLDILKIYLSESKKDGIQYLSTKKFHVIKPNMVRWGKNVFIRWPFFLQNLDVSARLIFRFSFVRKSFLSSFKAVSSPWALVCVQYFCFAGQKLYTVWSSSWRSWTLIATIYFFYLSWDLRVPCTSRSLILLVYWSCCLLHSCRQCWISSSSSLHLNQHEIELRAFKFSHFKGKTGYCQIG